MNVIQRGCQEHAGNKMFSSKIGFVFSQVHVEDVFDMRLNLILCIFEKSVSCFLFF